MSQKRGRPFIDSMSDEIIDLTGPTVVYDLCGTDTDEPEPMSLAKTSVPNNKVELFQMSQASGSFFTNNNDEQPMNMAKKSILIHSIEKVEPKYDIAALLAPVSCDRVLRSKYSHVDRIELTQRYIDKRKQMVEEHANSGSPMKKLKTYKRASQKSKNKQDEKE